LLDLGTLCFVFMIDLELKMSDHNLLKLISTNPVQNIGYGVDLRAGLCHSSVMPQPPILGFSQDISTGPAVFLMKGLGTRPLHWDYSVTDKTLNIASDSINDVFTSGTGAWQVRVQITSTTGLISGFAQLNGQTPVALKTVPGGATDAQGLNINSITVFEVGSGKGNAGNLYVSNDAGGAWTAGVPPNIQGVVVPGDNISQLGHFQVPGGMVGYLMQINGNTDLPTSNELLIDAVFRISSANVNRQMDQIPFSSAINGSNILNLPLPASTTFPPLTGITFKVAKISGGSSHVLNFIAHMALQKLEDIPVFT